MSLIIWFAGHTINGHHELDKNCIYKLCKTKSSRYHIRQSGEPGPNNQFVNPIEWSCKIVVLTLLHLLIIFIKVYIASITVLCYEVYISKNADSNPYMRLLTLLCSENSLRLPGSNHHRRPLQLILPNSVRSLTCSHPFLLFPYGDGST